MGSPGGYGYDHFVHWAMETAALGGIALLVLLRIFEGLRDGRDTDLAWLRRATGLSAVAAGCCAGATLIAYWYRQSLLAQSPSPDVRVFVAGGLSVVNVAGAVGSILALLLAALVWSLGGRFGTMDEAPPRVPALHGALLRRR